MRRIEIIQNQDGYPLKDDHMISQFCDECHSSILARITLDEHDQIIDPVCSLCKAGIF